jgi:phosphatidylserine/phosphatidylglycerophosphate/cardiolipin synthase-like enzyme
MRKLAVVLLLPAIIVSSCHKKDNPTMQTVNSGQVVVTYYSPQINLEKIDEDWLKMSKIPKKLYIAMYAFTDKNLANEIIQLANDGVEVYIYRDSEQMQDKGDTTEMFKGIKNIHIKAKNSKGLSNIMHDKIFIVPGVVFREGSANWSPSAEQDNNATYITDKVEMEKAEKVFWDMWNREDNIVIQ